MWVSLSRYTLLIDELPSSNPNSNLNQIFIIVWIRLSAPKALRALQIKHDTHEYFVNDLQINDETRSLIEISIKELEEEITLVKELL